MARYTEVKSEFIKGKIRGANWNNPTQRGYIDTLIELEEYVLYGGRQWANAIRLFWLAERYKQEYHIILKELKPERYSREIIEEKEQEMKSKEENARWEKEHKEVEGSLRRDWIEAGGTEKPHRW